MSCYYRTRFVDGVFSVARRLYPRPWTHTFNDRLIDRDMAATSGEMALTPLVVDPVDRRAGIDSGAFVDTSLALNWGPKLVADVALEPAADIVAFGALRMIGVAR